MSYQKADIERLSDDALLTCVLPRLREAIDDLLGQGIRPGRIRRWLHEETGGPNAHPGELQFYAAEVYLERALQAAKERRQATVTPFDLRPGVRVRQATIPPLLDQPHRRAELQKLVGRLGTVELVSDNKTAFIRWDDGSSGAWTWECLDLAGPAAGP